MPFKVFSRIADRYDLANRLLSFGSDLFWRKALIRELKRIQPNPKRFLDIACGSGDVLALAKEKYPKGVGFVGLDPCGEMIEVAQKKVGSFAFLIRGQAENLPFKGGSFDIVSVSFGVRNFSDRLGGIREIFRVLKPKGVLGVLEFSPPEKGNLFLKLGWFYTERLVPLLGGIIAGDRSAYEYLARSIAQFPKAKDFVREVESVGFKTLEVRKFPPSPAVLYLFEKPGGKR